MRCKNTYKNLFVSFISLFFAGSAIAEDKPLLGIDGLSGRATLTSDVWGAVSGGVERGATELNNLDVIFDLDTEKASLWSHGKFHTYILADWGGGPGGYTGALQANDNIQAPDTVKLYEAYYEHEFCDACVTVLFGLHNYNSEFALSEYAGVFIHSSPGIDPVTSQVGPSIFPTTALGLRIKVNPSENSYALGAIYDGVPGDPNNSKGTHIILDRNDGVYLASEVGLRSSEGSSKYKLGVGGWYRTTDFENYAGDEYGDNHGFYLIGDKSLYSEPEDDSQGLGMYLQAAWAPDSRNKLSRYFGGGFSYTGLIPDRDSDTLAIGVCSAFLGDAYKDYDTESKSSETAIELTYRAPVTDWLTVQPDLQFLNNPGAMAGVSNAWLVGLRIQLSI